MIIMLSVLVSAILVVIAVFHLLWGLRIWVPVKGEAQLAKTVAGFEDIENMPKSRACFVVTLYLCFAALLTLISGGIVSSPDIGQPLIQLGTIVVALVFLMRGLFAYTQKWASMTPEQPFRKLDKLYYSPLCLFIGASIVCILAFNF